MHAWLKKRKSVSLQQEELSTPSPHGNTSSCRKDKVPNTCNPEQKKLSAEAAAKAAMMDFFLFLVFVTKKWVHSACESVDRTMKKLYKHYGDLRSRCTSYRVYCVKRNHVYMDWTLRNILKSETLAKIIEIDEGIKSDGVKNRRNREQLLHIYRSFLSRGTWRSNIQKLQLKITRILLFLQDERDLN